MNNGTVRWKEITESGGKYSVSDCGFVRNNATNDFLQQRPDKDGYLNVGLFFDGVSHTRKVHRLVAQAFIPNLCGLPTVNHINEVKSDNRVCNLEWASYRTQVNHGTRSRRAMESMDSYEIEQILPEGTVIRHKSVRDAARKMGVKPERIIWCLKGRSHTAAGCEWRYCRQHKSVEGRKESVSVSQYDLNGKLIANYRSVNAAAKALGISPSGISFCINGKRKTNAGFIWKKNESPIEEYRAPTISVLQMNSDGDIIRCFESVTDAAKAVGKSTGDICRCLKGRRNSCGGYQWKYA